MSNPNTVLRHRRYEGGDGAGGGGGWSVSRWLVARQDIPPHLQVTRIFSGTQGEKATPTISRPSYYTDRQVSAWRKRQLGLPSALYITLMTYRCLWAARPSVRDAIWRIVMVALGGALSLDYLFHIFILYYILFSRGCQS